jgi:hypothetical protein
MIAGEGHKVRIPGRFLALLPGHDPSRSAPDLTPFRRSRRTCAETYHNTASDVPVTQSSGDSTCRFDFLPSEFVCSIDNVRSGPNPRNWSRGRPGGRDRNPNDSKKNPEMREPTGTRYDFESAVIGDELRRATDERVGC